MHTSWHQKGAAAYPPLKENIEADVVVIGGGLAGVLTAYTLQRAGKKVVLLERDSLGGGATALTTAFLTQAIDTALADLVRMLGESGARMAWTAGKEAIEQLERIARDQDIACELVRCPARVYARNKAEYESLEEEARVARRLGFGATLKRDDALHFPNAGYLEIPDQAKFHPLKFIHLLAARIADAGVRIHEHTQVVALSKSGPVIVTTTSGNTVHARDAIVATYLPFNNPKPTHFKKGPYRSYVLEVVVPHGRIPEGIYWDLHRPYDYFRVDPLADGERIIVGGADHRQELPVSRKKSFGALERYLKVILGDVPYRIVRTWSGPIIESSDGLPLIGAYAPHRYVATAFSGNGMTYAMVSALMLRDLISGSTHPWAALYDPKRSLKPYRLLIKGRDYLMEFFGGALRNTFR